MYRYRIQKQVLPIGAAADLHRFPGTPLLFSRILAPFFYVPFISFFSSQLLSTRVGSLHFSCTCPSLFQPSRMTQLQTLLMTQLNCLSIGSWLFFCVIIFVSCTIIKPTALESLHKALPGTTSYYKSYTKYVPVLLRTSKLAQSTSQYYFVLQSLHKTFPSTTLYYNACTKYVLAPLRTAKLAQSTSR